MSSVSSCSKETVYNSSSASSAEIKVSSTETVIFQATYDKDGVFRASGGYHPINLRQFDPKKITTLEVSDSTDLEDATASLANGRTRFIWFRAHGKPTEMKFSDEYTLKSVDIPAIFLELPKKLTDDAIIYLDSCSTGSLQGEFWNNIQFSFAKLTLDMPNVRVVAPKENAHRSLILKTFEGFQFETIASPASKLTDITVILGAKTKALIQGILQKKSDFSLSKEVLLESLERNGGWTKKILEIYKIDNGIDITHLIMRQFKGTFPPSDSTDYKKIHRWMENQAYHGIKDLVKIFGANTCPTYPLLPEQTSPLFAAVNRGYFRLTRHLLEQGADPSVAFRDTGLTARTFAEQKGYPEIAKLIAEWEK